MTSTVILCSSAALLAVLALILGTYLWRLRKENKYKHLSLGGVFLALGVLPMAVVMFAEFKRGAIPAFNYLAFLRSPFFMADVTFDVFAQMNEFSFLIDFFSTVTFTTIVVVSVSECVHLFSRDVYSSADDEQQQAASEVSDPVADRAAATPYIEFCRLLN